MRSYVTNQVDNMRHGMEALTLGLHTLYSTMVRLRHLLGCCKLDDEGWITPWGEH